MHARQQPPAPGTQQARRLVQAARNAGIAALHRLQGHGAKAHQICPDNAHRRGGKQRAQAPFRAPGLQPAHRQQHAHHNHRPRHGIAHAGQAHHGLRAAAGATAQGKRQQQRQRHRQHGGDAAQAHAVARPLHKTLPRQHRPIGCQRAQHEGHRGHKAQQHRQQAHRPGQRTAHPVQALGLRFGTAGTARAAGGKAHTPLRALLQPQQHQHQAQQHGGQLRGRNAVVHRQPGFVDAGGEGLDAKVAHHAKVGQSLHQHQGHACRHRRACQRQGNVQHPPRQRGTHQAGGLHQVGSALAQGRAGQQVHVGVERKNKHPHRPAQAAHFGQQAPLPTKTGTQPHLQGATELQEIGVSVGRHVGGHGQRQQQQPLHLAPPRKIKQRHGSGRTHTHQRCAQPHPQRQPQRGVYVAGQHRRGHFAQDGPGLGVSLPPRQPGTQQRQHGQRQQRRQRPQGQQAQRAHRANNRRRGGGRQGKVPAAAARACTAMNANANSTQLHRPSQPG